MRPRTDRWLARSESRPAPATAGTSRCRACRQWPRRLSLFDLAPCDGRVRRGLTATHAFFPSLESATAGCGRGIDGGGRTGDDACRITAAGARKEMAIMRRLLVRRHVAGPWARRPLGSTNPVGRRGSDS